VANWASELVWWLWRKDKTLTLSGIKRRLLRLGGCSLVNTQAGDAESGVEGSALAHWDFDGSLLNPKTKYVQKLIKQQHCCRVKHLTLKNLVTVHIVK
jgi:hypothetical protein